MSEIRTRNRKWWIKRIGLGVVLLLVAGLAILAYNPLRTLASLKKVDDYSLYTMRYRGGYLFDWYLRQGIESPIFKTLEGMNSAGSCTTFTASSPQGEFILGRNFDYHAHPALLLFTHPPGGYASVSMVDMYYLGYRGQERSWTQRLKLLFAPYVTVDGMNEHGLAVSSMKVPCRIGPRDPQKKTIIGNHALRLVLDRARNVDEALALIEDFNFHFPQACTHHLFADASGDSAVVEYINGEIAVTRGYEPWQVVTNFLVSEEEPDGPNSSCWRYNGAYKALEQANGRVSTEGALSILSEAAVHSSEYITLWSSVYNLTTGDVMVVMGREYDRVHVFRLDD